MLPQINWKVILKQLFLPKPLIIKPIVYEKKYLIISIIFEIVVGGIISYFLIIR